MSILPKLVVLTTFLASRSDSLPIYNENQASAYLLQFGYLSPDIGSRNSSGLMSRDLLTDAIREFQAFAGLNVTGDLSQETVRLMNTPRCGLKDKNDNEKSSRNKRFAIRGSKYKAKNLTYRILKYPRSLTKAETEKALQQAFDVWASVTPLNFTHKSTGRVNFKIRFERGLHGNKCPPFDGPGHTLGHASYPDMGGNVHFDDDEVFTINSRSGTNLQQIAAHEFGHSLGLYHSNVHGALMTPFYHGYDPFFKLHDDDVQAIQILYGEKGSDNQNSRSDTPTDVPSASVPSTNTTSTNALPTDVSSVNTPSTNTTSTNALPTNVSSANTPSTNTTSTNALPTDVPSPNAQSSDAPSVNSPSTDTTSNNAPPTNVPSPYTPAGAPLHLEERDGDLCKDTTIDTIFTSATGTTYIFKGQHYWELTDRGLKERFPRLISYGWRGLPGYIDAAFYYHGNGKTYFFKGSKYWSYTGRLMDWGYPREISNTFIGIPNSVDAAVASGNGLIAFFKDSVIWVYDPFRMQPTYSYPINYLEGIPNNLDAALRLTSGHILLFKGGSYWTLNEKTNTVEYAYPPRSAGMFFGCVKQEDLEFGLAILHELKQLLSNPPPMDYDSNPILPNYDNNFY